jgi:hypothetical protein
VKHIVSADPANLKSKILKKEKYYFTEHIPAFSCHSLNSTDSYLHSICIELDITGNVDMICGRVM